MTISADLKAKILRYHHVDRFEAVVKAWRTLLCTFREEECLHNLLAITLRRT